jgi:hypothetical protein
MPKEKEVIFGSLAWEAQQLVRAVEVEKHMHDVAEEVSRICPECKIRPRVYSNGRLYSYCSPCRKAINKRRYRTTVKKK